MGFQTEARQEEETGSLLGEEMPDIMGEEEKDEEEEEAGESNQDWLAPERRDSDEGLRLTGGGEEKEDPFSLKGTDVRKTAEAVSLFLDSIRWR